MATSLAAPHSDQYRPDIDGLRALAVLAVVGYHAFPQQISGGFIGVDIFFVISGYLIAKIIFQEMIRGSFTITGFYARRIKRIFPALILVTFITFLIGWNFLAPVEFRSLGTNLAGSSVFLQNIVLLNQGGYFDLAADKKPLLHLWSLGIEEQYYIVWPLLLLAIRRWKLNALNLTCIFALTSLIACILLYKKHSEMAFYLPFTRCWELLLGAALAIQIILQKESFIANWLKTHIEPVLKKIIWDEPQAPRSEHFRHNLYAFIAVGLIIFGLFHFNQHTHYPSYRALIPVIAALLLILSSNSWINKKLLSSRGMVVIGLISYPLYLWHFPLMAYAKILSPDKVPAAIMAGLVVLSFILAGLTYVLIERPIRYSKSRRYKISLLLLSMGIIGALGLYVVLNKGLVSRMPSLIRNFMLSGEETSAFWRRGSCLLLPEQKSSAFSKDCSDRTGPRPLIFVWGDSYAAAFYAGLNNLKTKHGYSVAEYTASACPPMIGFVHPDRPHCKEINDYALKQAAASRPEVVILHSTWRYDPTVMSSGLQATVAALRALNIPRIVLLGPVPTWKGNGLSENVLDYYFQNKKHGLIPLRTNYRLNSDLDQPLDLELQQQAASLGIEYISPMQVMCEQSGCLARIGKDGSELTAFDNGHMTMAGSTYLVQSILPQLLHPSDTQNRLGLHTKDKDIAHSLDQQRLASLESTRL